MIVNVVWNVLVSRSYKIEKMLFFGSALTKCYSQLDFVFHKLVEKRDKVLSYFTNKQDYNGTLESKRQCLLILRSLKVQQPTSEKN